MRIDDLVTALAARQYGLASTSQIRELGGDHRLIRRRVADGRWEKRSSRVIRITGTPTSLEQDLMVRVLQAGPTGMASHEGAGWLWRVPGIVETDAVMRSQSHGASAQQGHRPTLVLPHHRTEVRGIPCTTLPRTIFDLAGLGMRPERIERLVHTVVTKSPAMLPALHRTLDELACRGRPGITTMRQVLEELPVGSKVPASGLEKRFEEICHNAGIRELERQLDAGGHSWLGRVDYVLRRLKLLIEVDSRLHHTSPLDVANDKARDEAMLAAGWRKVLRVAEEDIWNRPWFVVEQVRAAIQELESTER